MLREQPWFDFCDALPIEIEQRIEEGAEDAARFKECAEQVKEMPRGAARTAAGAELLEQLCALENSQDKDEPSDLPGIKAASAGEPKEKAEADYDKIYGAWLGRCAGCLLGQPVEGWRRARINGLLKETGNLPLQNYISSDIGPILREKYNVRDDGHAYGAEKTGWINNVSYMPEDDDTNYTLIALKLVEQYGRDFTPDDAAENWLMNLPLLHLCTAERVAYINLAQSIFPPESAAYRNPYREWIGAQIRGDLFGYICPGDTETAAEMAWRDASISHVKNGIYGKYDENNPHHWCHTISNAAIVAMGLLWGKKDFTYTMELCLTMGFDTDCNCATAGSVLGMVLGAQLLPEVWTAPLNDRVLSGVDGFGLVHISDMAARTQALIE